MAVDGECDARARGGRMLRESGYHEDNNASMIKSAMHQHSQQKHAAGKSHVGETHLKLRRGGKVHGKEAAHRPDRRARGGMISIDQPDDADGNDVKDSGRARGGKVGAKRVQIVVNAGPKGDPQREQMAHQAGIQQGLAVGKSAGMPHPAGPPPGAMPGGPPAGMPPGAMAGKPPMGPPGGGMPPRPMGPPPGAGMMARGGAMRDQHGRFMGGRV